jgi:hypothetical protein
LASQVTAQPSSRTVAIRAETLSPLNVRPTFDNGYLVVYEGDRRYAVWVEVGLDGKEIGRWPVGAA